MTIISGNYNNNNNNNRLPVRRDRGNGGSGRFRSAVRGGGETADGRVGHFFVGTAAEDVEREPVAGVQRLRRQDSLIISAGGGGCCCGGRGGRRRRRGGMLLSGPRFRRAFPVPFVLM